MISFTNFPCAAIPRVETQAYVVLTMLMKSNCSTTDLTNALGGKNPRSALQSLMNEVYDFWNISNIGISGSQEGFYNLDPRHLSNDTELDRQARVERSMTLLKNQKERGLKTANKLPNTIKALEKAEELFGPQLQLPIPDNK